MADSYSDRDPVEELAEEYLVRLRRGEAPTLSEYTAAYPEHAEAIRELFPALVKIERLRPGADEADEEDHLIDPDTGRRIGRLGDFRIIREIGRGGMGAVYEAEQVSLGRRVALKVLIRRATRDRKTVERFRREARAAAASQQHRARLRSRPGAGPGVLRDAVHRGPGTGPGDRGAVATPRRAADRRERGA
jgi:hypothetical protein